jgi:hypothetical protein
MLLSLNLVVEDIFSSFKSFSFHHFGELTSLKQDVVSPLECFHMNQRKKEIRFTYSTITNMVF